jgi:hypothetical protein
VGSDDIQVIRSNTSNEHLSLYTHFLYDMKHATSGRWLANPNHAHSLLRHDFWGLYEYPSHCQSEDFMSTKWSYNSPQLSCSLLHLEWLTKFEHTLHTSLLEAYSQIHIQPYNTQI